MLNLTKIQCQLRKKRLFAVSFLLIILKIEDIAKGDIPSIMGFAVKAI